MYTTSRFCIDFVSVDFLDNRTNPVEFQADGSKVRVTWVFWCFSCLCDVAATRGQYLALSKA